MYQHKKNKKKTYDYEEVNEQKLERRITIDKIDYDCCELGLRVNLLSNFFFWVAPSLSYPPVLVHFFLIPAFQFLFFLRVGHG